MSLVAVCAWSFLRAIVIALVAVILSKGVASFVGRAASLPVKFSSERNTGKLAAYATKSRLVWALLLAPFLVPPLLVGYAYARLALLLIHYPFWNDVTYGLLLLLKFFPAAVVIRVFAPPSPVSPEAIHLERLLRRPGEPVLRRVARELGSWIAGPGRRGDRGVCGRVLARFSGIRDRLAHGNHDGGRAFAGELDGVAL